MRQSRTRRRWTRWLTALTAAGAVTALAGAGPAWASHDGIHPAFQAERAWFHCAGAVPVSNAGWWVEGAAPWDRSAPTGSLSQGDGCTHADAAVYDPNPDSPHDAVFYGSFAGNLRDLTVTLHDVVAGQVRPEEATAVPLCVRLSVDTVPVLPTECETAPPVWAVPVADESGLVERLEFSITGLGSVTEVTDEQGNVVDVHHEGLATEDGPGSRQRTLLLTVSVMLLDPDWVQTGLFTWDAVETPSGIAFNPAVLAPARIRATL